MNGSVIKDERIINFIVKETAQQMIFLSAADWLYALASKVGGERSMCLEIGSGYGCSATIKEKGGKLVSVDSFLEPAHKSVSFWGRKPFMAEIFRDNLKRFEIDAISIIGDAVEIVPLFKDEMFDLIWINACHKYESVKKDILNSVPKLKKGGILCGHDIRPKEWPDDEANGIKTAVEEIFGNHFKVTNRIWVVD